MTGIVPTIITAGTIHGIMGGTIPGITAVIMADITVDITVAGMAVTEGIIIAIITAIITIEIRRHTVEMAARETGTREIALPSTGALHRRQEGHTALRYAPLPTRVEAQPTHRFAVRRAENIQTAVAGNTPLPILRLLPAVRHPQTAVSGKALPRMFQRGHG